MLDILKARYKAVNSTTKMLVILLILTVLFNIGFNKIYKPQERELAKLKRKLVSLENEVLEVESEFPDFEEKNELLDQKKTEINKLKKELSSKESQLLSKKNLPELLNVLLEQSPQYLVDFNLVKPVEGEEDNVYEQLNIEMQFDAGFNGVIDYLERLEKSFQYIQTKGVVISSEEAVNEQLGIKLVLSTYLTDYLKDKISLPVIDKTKQTSASAIKRDPFYSADILFTQDVEEQAYQLSGIISQGTQPTAIIDDEVYRVGDYVGDSQVKEILYNKVVLEKKGKLKTLTLE